MKPCADMCCVKKCGKPAHADLWIKENGAWASFCTPHARFALKPTYTEMGKSGMTWNQIEDFLERMRQGFYFGCRMDEHSPQINEFVESMVYYLDKEKTR